MEADYIVYDAETPFALLEMARRDAVRLLPHQGDQIRTATGNILHITVSKTFPLLTPVLHGLSGATQRAAT